MPMSPKSKNQHPVLKLFGGKKVEDFPMLKREVVEIDVLAPVEKAIRCMEEAHISSVPVYDYCDKKYVGFVDTSDLVTFVVAAHTQSGIKGSKMVDAFTSLRNLLGHVAMHTYGKPAVDIIDLSKNNPWVAVKEGTNAKDAVELLAHGLLPEAKGLPNISIHRVPILDESGKCVRILSQSSVIQYLGFNIEKLGRLRNMTLDELKIAKKGKMIVVEDTETALKAFELMNENRLSAIPVVSEGRLITNVSNSDVQVALSGDFGPRSESMLNMIGLKVMDFVTKCRTHAGSSGPSKYGKSFPAAVTVHPDTTLGETILKLAATGLHRVYVTDEDGFLVGVVSLKDVLRIIMQKVWIGDA